MLVENSILGYRKRRFVRVRGFEKMGITLNMIVGVIWYLMPYGNFSDDTSYEKYWMMP